MGTNPRVSKIIKFNINSRSKVPHKLTMIGGKGAKAKDNSVVFMDTDQAHKIINQNSYKKKLLE